MKRSKTLIFISILLIIAGVVAIVVRDISYTEKEQVIDAGPVEASIEKRKFIRIPTIAGVLVATTGLVILVIQLRKRS